MQGRGARKLTSVGWVPDAGGAARTEHGVAVRQRKRLERRGLAVCRVGVCTSGCMCACMYVCVYMCRVCACTCAAMHSRSQQVMDWCVLVCVCMYLVTLHTNPYLKCPSTCAFGFLSLNCNTFCSCAAIGTVHRSSRGWHTNTNTHNHALACLSKQFLYTHTSIHPCNSSEVPEAPVAHTHTHTHIHAPVCLIQQLW